MLGAKGLDYAQGSQPLRSHLEHGPKRHGAVQFHRELHIAELLLNFLILRVAVVHDAHDYGSLICSTHLNQPSDASISECSIRSYDPPYLGLSGRLKMNAITMAENTTGSTSGKRQDAELLMNEQPNSSHKQTMRPRPQYIPNALTCSPRLSAVERSRSVFVYCQLSSRSNLSQSPPARR